MKIKGLNDKYKVTMFMTNVYGGKAFTTEQKMRELKNRISKEKTNIELKQIKSSTFKN